MAAQQTQRLPQYNNNGYLPNGAPPTVSGPVPGATPLLPNQGRVIQSGPSRVLCVADVRGNLRSLNELAKAARADYIIHTGDFGFYDERSLDRIAEKTLKHVAQYSPLISEETRRQVTASQGNPPIKDRIPRDQLPLSQLPLFLNGTYSFDVPVYTVWGACEDVQVLEKLRSGEYKVDKLHIIDESHSRLLDIGGVKLRLLGLGGAVVMHKLFDNGEGRTTIAGGGGTMWTTLLQMGELVDTAKRVYDPSETRVLVTHASPAREGLLNQLSVTLKVDFSISAGLHFRYGSSYNEFSVNPTLDHYRGKLAASKASFNDVWETVKSEVEPAVQENDAQQKLLNNALDIVQNMPSVANGGNPFGGQASATGGQIDEMAFKNMWNFNLADAAFGWLVLEIESGRIGTEMKAQGFNFAHRGQKNPNLQNEAVKAASSPALATSPNVPPMSTPGTQLPQGQPRPNAPTAAPQPQAPTQNRATPQGRGHTNQALSQARPAQATPSAVPATQTISPPPTTGATQASKSATSPAPLTPVSPGPAGTTDKTNGTTSSTPADENSKDAITPKSGPTTGIFITKASTEEEAKGAFTEEDQAKIVRMVKFGYNFVAHFSSPEEAQAVLKAANEDKKRGTSGDKVVLKPYEERRPRTYDGNNSWNSTRGGSGQSGYRSGGASDSEGGRGGRGGSFRGRARGSDRGRGGRGRGTYNKGAEGASPSPAAAASSGTTT